MENMNWLSVVLATLLPSIMGFLYYNPKTVGKAWMDSLGITEEDIQNSGGMAVKMGLSVVLAFLLSFYLVMTVNGPGQEGEFDTFQHGAFHGFGLALTVALPVLITNGLFEMKTWKNLLINALYWMITIILMGGILDAMNHWPNEVAM